MLKLDQISDQVVLAQKSISSQIKDPSFTHFPSIFLFDPNISVLILFSLLLLLPLLSWPLFPLDVLFAFPFDTEGSVEFVVEVCWPSRFTCFMNCRKGVLLLELDLPDCLLIVWLLVLGLFRALGLPSSSRRGTKFPTETGTGVSDFAFPVTCWSWVWIVCWTCCWNEFCCENRRWDCWCENCEKLWKCV